MGRRKLSLRLAAGYNEYQLGQSIVAQNGDAIVRLADIARRENGLRQTRWGVQRKRRHFHCHQRAGGQNVSVLEVMERLNKVVADLDRGVLKQHKLSITQVYDETVYINQAIDQVYANLFLGILLAISILWWFMRRFKATMIVAFCIPLTLFSAFIMIA